MITKVDRRNELQECWKHWLNNDYQFNRGQHWVLHFDNNLSYQNETYNIERLMKKFLRRLDRRCHRKQRNRIERINFIEGIGSQKRNHCHLLLNQSSHLNQEQFKSEVLSSIDDTSKYHSIFYTKDRSQIKKMNKTGKKVLFKKGSNKTFNLIPVGHFSLNYNTQKIIHRLKGAIEDGYCDW